LIVDDDVGAIRILQRSLTSIGEVHFANSGAEALRLARSLKPHLILLDAHMPDLDGFQVCAALKAEPGFEHTPIVFVTRFSDPRNEMRALDLGAADFIAKPYTPAVLLARVRNLLDLQRRAAAELQSVREHWRSIGDARVAAIVAGASDAIVSVDAQEAVMLANAAAGRLFGRECAQMIGMPVRELLGEGLEMGTPSPAPLRIMVKRGDQGAIPVEASVSRVGEGPAASTTLMLRDVSDRERLESESRARIEAETASRTKTLMMSYLAHEIGNPLNGILGMAGLMERDTDNPLGPKQATRLAHLLTSGRSLETLMRDVLDVGRFETGKLMVHLLDIDATRCAAQASAAVSVMAMQAGVTLSPPQASPPIHALADGARLQQCLANLLTNAIKYNRPGGWVRVDVQDGPAEVTITVRDNGLGMDAAQLEQLFEPFNRAGRQHTAAPGAGLGLMIARQLVGAMHGRLVVQSDAGLGSCFSIILPGAPAPGPGQPT
jgi:PAS domain S-box-containing protein